MTAHEPADRSPTPREPMAHAPRRHLKDELDENDIAAYRTLSFRGQLLADAVLQTHIPGRNGRCQAFACNETHPCRQHRTAAEAKRRDKRERPPRDPQP